MYIRQRFSSASVHFTFRKAIVTFHLPPVVGPFVANLRNYLVLVDEMLQHFNFPQVGVWNYDPDNIIYDIRKNRDQENHRNDSNPILEKRANKFIWDEVVAFKWIKHFPPLWEENHDIIAHGCG